MQIKVSTLVLASAITAIAALIPVSAMAAAPANASNVHVPFSFSVNGVILPAGDYIVDRDAAGSVIYLKNIHGGRTYSWISHPAPDANGRVVLYFEARRQSHVLQSIQFGALVTPLLVSKAAMEGVPPETIVGR
jgi:hypothetical protein